MMVDVPRLRGVLGSPELAWLLQRVRQRLERGASVTGKVVLRDPSAAQRSALDRLLGRPASRSASLTVSLSQLEEKVRQAGIAIGLEEAVEALTGPVVNVRAEQAHENRRWERLFEDAQRRGDRRGKTRGWLHEIRTSGLLRRLARQDVDAARSLLDAALGLVDRLPAQGIPLTELAASVSGDSHALDAGKPLATLAMRAAASLAGVKLEDTAEARRNMWASVGVLCDELSAPVLTLNLRADAESLTGRALRLHAESGEPYRLTVRQILRHPPTFGPATVGPAVYVCENPSVVAAAANRLGAGSTPLVCVEGQPKTAARLLLDRLGSAGVRLVYHGDFDWGGVRVANLVMQRHGAAPWRMSADDYRAVVDHGISLSGSPVAAAWDAGLEAAMVAAGRAVHEEAVLESLLCDLAAAPRD